MADAPGWIYTHLEVVWERPKPICVWYKNSSLNAPPSINHLHIIFELDDLQVAQQEVLQAEIRFLVLTDPPKYKTGQRHR